MPPPAQVGRDCDLAIFFDCPESVMLKRLMGRNTGRADDNEATIRKRVQVRRCASSFTMHPRVAGCGARPSYTVFVYERWQSFGGRRETCSPSRAYDCVPAPLA